MCVSSCVFKRKSFVLDIQVDECGAQKFEADIGQKVGKRWFRGIQKTIHDMLSWVNVKEGSRGFVWSSKQEGLKIWQGFTWFKAMLQFAHAAFDLCHMHVSLPPNYGNTTVALFCKFKIIWGFQGSIRCDLSWLHALQAYIILTLDFRSLFMQCCTDCSCSMKWIQGTATGFLWIALFTFSLGCLPGSLAPAWHGIGLRHRGWQRWGEIGQWWASCSANYVAILQRSLLWEWASKVLKTLPDAVLPFNA